MIVNIGGIDEAGRGPVIGPLVICLAELKQKDILILEELGVKDSKLLNRVKRKLILNNLNKKKIAKFTYSILNAKILSEKMKNLSLTTIELEEMVKLTKKSKAKKIIIDCPSSGIKNFENTFINKLDKDQLSKSNSLIKEKTLLFEHKADLNYLIVSLASIAAKEKREEILDELKIKYGDFGSGYPSDPKTIKYLDEKPELTIIRTNWQTWKKKQQYTLERFKI